MAQQVTLIANRYELLEELGKGGMGAVYRVKDQLTNTIMALKRVLVPTSKLDFSLSNSSQNRYIALATEFRTLATLRHPHIISVQDYGFSADGQPYFTMEYLPNATSITDYARSQSLDVKIRLITETLQSLAYLHQRGIIHRDLKPGNILVDQYGVVKVLDFGLAIAATADLAGDKDGPPAGTVAYMAPELFTDPPSVQSDLYAVGVIAYELFAGHYPFDSSSFMTLFQNILGKHPDLKGIDSRVMNFVDILMSKEPSMRPQSARLAIQELYAGLDQKIPDESTTIRESFLQASTFVGRRPELDTFKEALQALMIGTGSAWLLGGESGSGKSRLIEEVRTRALVEGVRVLRGQSAANGLAYQTWRDVLRPLMLTGEISDLDAGILKEIVPDIESLVGRAIPDLAGLAGKANQERLGLSILEILKRQTDPILLLLEDLQWGGESVALLQTVLQQRQSLNLMIVGTYRTDEAPDLPEQLPDMKPMQLGRLDATAVAQLSQSMLGAAAQDPQLLALLNKETEGNVFFIVEVMRALAEEAGSLTGIGKTELPQRVMAGGMQQVLRRRLNRMPDWTRQALKLAAIAGRGLDRAVLAAAAPAHDVEAFVSAGANAAVFDVADGNWRFSHDKLREALLDDLTADEKPTLYRQVAQGIEATYPDDPAYAAILAQYWDEAGVADKTVAYTIQATRRIVDSTAEYTRANVLLERALKLVTPDNPDYARLRYIAGEIYVLQGSYDLASDQYQKCLDNTETNQAQYVQSLLRMSEIKARQIQLTEAVHYLDRAVQQSKEIVDDALLSDVLFYQGRFAQVIDDYQAAFDYFEQSLQIERGLNRLYRMAIRMTQLGVIAGQLGNLELAESYFEQGLQIQKSIQDKHNMAASYANLGFLALLKQNYDLADQYIRQGLEVFRNIGSRYGEGHTLIDLGSIAVARQQYHEAIVYFEHSLMINREIRNVPAVVIGLNELANLHLLQGNHQSARDSLSESLQLSSDIQALPHLLTGIVLVAHLFHLDGDSQLAMTLVTFCAQHEAMPSDERGRYLEPLQHELQSLLSEADYLTSQQVGRGYQLETLIQLLSDKLTETKGEKVETVDVAATTEILLGSAWSQYFRELDRYRRQRDQSLNPPKGATLQEHLAVETLANLAETAYLKGNWVDGSAYLEQTTIVLESISDPQVKAQNLMLLGQIAVDAQNFDSARFYLEQRLMLEREQGNVAQVACALFDIGLTYAHQAQWPQASDYFEECIVSSRNVVDQIWLALGLTGLGLVAFVQTDDTRATQLLTEAMQVFRQEGNEQGEMLVQRYLDAMGTNI